MRNRGRYHSLAETARETPIRIVSWPLEYHTMGYRQAEDLLTSDLKEQLAEQSFAGPPRSIVECGP